MGAADCVEFVHSQQSGTRHHEFVGASVLSWRRNHRNARHPGNLRGNDIHQQRRRVKCPPARNVHSGTVHGRHLPAKDGAVRTEVELTVGFLAFVEATNVRGCSLQHVPEFHINRIECLLKLWFRNPEVLHMHTVKTRGVLLHRCIASTADILENRPDGFGNIR